MSVKLWNTSALGVYGFAWYGSDKRRCEAEWFRGLREPLFSFYSAELGKMTPFIPIRNPERFGYWPLSNQSHAKALADFKAFVTAFAEECEEEGEADD